MVWHWGIAAGRLLGRWTHAAGIAVLLNGLEYAIIDRSHYRLKVFIVFEKSNRNCFLNSALLGIHATAFGINSWLPRFEGLNPSSRL